MRGVPNHRGNIRVSSGFLNEKRKAEDEARRWAEFAEKNPEAAQMAVKGWSGLNYDPEQSMYDEAYGPAERVGRQNRIVGGEFLEDLEGAGLQEMTTLERRYRGEN